MKGKIETAALAIAALMIGFDIMAMALEFHTTLQICLRFIYIPVFAYNGIQTAIADSRHQKEQYRQLDIIRKKKAQQQFLEDYAKFVSEVHK